VFVQASAPPPAVAPAPPAQAMRLMTIAQRARPVTLTKGGRTEMAVVSHQIFLKTSVRSSATATIEGQAVSATPCAWTIEVYLQRVICFSSMTGQTSCTDPMSTPLAAGETGQADLAADQACDVMAKPIALSEGRVAASLDKIAATVFEDDYKIKVRPMLTAAGVTLSERPSKAAPSRASGSGTR
jgi:hypothetical protein